MSTAFDHHLSDPLLHQVAFALEAAKKHGATEADASASLSSGFAVNTRMGSVENIAYQRDKNLSITVYLGKKTGSASTNDTADASIELTVQKAIQIAKATGEDPCSGLPNQDTLALNYPDLDLYHHWDLSVEDAIEIAEQAEQVGLKADKRITNSEGASLSTYDNYTVMGNSLGFLGAYPSSYHSIDCALIAESPEGMERDFYYSSACTPSQLLSADKVALMAAQRTVNRLNAQKLSTRKAPVIFNADIAPSFLSCLVKAISGGNVYRQTTFLLDKINTPLFPAWLNISEHPHKKQSLYSVPFDSDGVKTTDKTIITEGILTTYLLSTYSGRKLNLPSTGNASGVHNLQVSTHDLDQAALLKKMNTGLLVTELFGNGINITTGDFSVGVFGFWVENGQIQYPVHEITIAGNLRDMFFNLVDIANDIDYRKNILTGSILLEEMTIAGS